MNPNRSLPLSVLRAAARQAYGDLRPNLMGAGATSILFAVAAILVVSRISDGPLQGFGSSSAFGTMLAASCVGGFASLVMMQIGAETYTDRIGGALLRVRILPHGPLTWAIGKTLSTVALVAVMQAMILLGAVLFIPIATPATGTALLCLLLAALASLACAPLGFFLSVFIRGVYSYMVNTVICLALFVAGCCYPTSALPGWVQGIQTVLPTYWSGHLTRWALVGDPYWEIGGSFHPALGFGVLLAWIIIGFGLVPPVIRRSFRKETIGGLNRTQSTIRSQTGL
ncbi:ABC transporter permease [Actinomyces succiniciruminis]|uniref:ABC-type drug export system membrane protein n=1 Tax=Actinomyces succiniciruminis TaxID=1522002 RepID=A0A1L7RA04_9ACTO|nr:ABC transporter permease [Actinomyces succiniciruminis]CED90671.1 ABC-type drug export system membrane protein [Actinomyces succiniciruminis]